MTSDANILEISVQTVVTYLSSQKATELVPCNAHLNTYQSHFPHATYLLLKQIKKCYVQYSQVIFNLVKHPIIFLNYI